MEKLGIRNSIPVDDENDSQNMPPNTKAPHSLNGYLSPPFRRTSGSCRTSTSSFRIAGAQVEVISHFCTFRKSPNETLCSHLPQKSEP
ncbi:inter-alpha-trypsin inhibitor heavy chain H3-like protein [Anopheles sinensis]|uniref:Inter-alpha-trypsin inhibitor heavy chain H3-like protein n=1 Tax=Anopheles sinensis TaxID=74873 RepID=A0A084VRI7_ANOSI|nr:inter-alpha-trypsin inhibitor heavy chain H3-like protein [Anopheles sinensis]